MIITLYAVRVKGTNRYLPRSQRRDERGGSWLEPIDFDDPASWPPRYSKNMMIRTYANRQGAENLMRSWVQGRIRSDGEWGGYQEERDSGINLGRDINNLEIAELKLVCP
jgi:hypothetical protein